MTGRRAVATLAASRGLCRLAAGALPRTVRARYAAEWQADLEADPTHTWAYATSVLLHVVALRLAVSQPSATRRPLRCRLHLHHDVSVHDNPDDRRFTSHVCTRWPGTSCGGSSVRSPTCLRRRPGTHWDSMIVDL